MRRLAGAGVLLAAACAGAPVALAEEPAHPAVAAAAEEVAAAKAAQAEPAVLERVELRVRDRDLDSTGGGGRALAVAARLPVRNPWVVSAEREARRSAVAEAEAGQQGAALSVRAARCTDGVRREAEAARGGLGKEIRGRAASVLAWNADWRAAGTLPDGDALRAELSLRRRLADGAGAAASEAATGALPGLEPPRATLLRDGATLDRIDARRPGARERAAAWDRFRAEAEGERLRALPWIGFVELGVEPAAGAPLGGLGGQIALDVPFGGDAGADAARLLALGRADARSRDAADLESRARVGEALGALAAFEAAAPEWRALLDAAAEAERLAERLASERLGTPRDAAALIAEAHAARAAALEARERAGEAGCALLGLTGVAPGEWPREEVR